MPIAVHYINLDVGGGDTMKYAWYADDAKYANILAGVGVSVAAANESGLIFGANKPKPVRVRLNFDDGSSQVIFCNPTNLGDVLGGSLNGNQSNGRTIQSAGLLG